MTDGDAGAIVITGISTFVALMIAGFIGLMMWGCPKYDVWQQEYKGRAELARAEGNRKIKIREAEAASESAKLLAAAEIERAKGVAEANRIIGESLKGNDAYLRYLWIQGLSENDSDVIYVPTEAQLPILEAARLLGAGTPADTKK